MRKQPHRIRHAAQRDFERDRHLLLDLLGGPARIKRDDVDLQIADVGKRLDGQRLEREQSAPHEDHEDQEDEQRLVQREVNDAFNHGCRFFDYEAATRLSLTPGFSPCFSPVSRRAKWENRFNGFPPGDKPLKRLVCSCVCHTSPKPLVATQVEGPRVDRTFLPLLLTQEGGEGRGEEVQLGLDSPSPRSSPHSFLAGRGRSPKPFSDCWRYRWLKPSANERLDIDGGGFPLNFFSTMRPRLRESVRAAGSRRSRCARRISTRRLQRFCRRARRPPSPAGAKTVRATPPGKQNAIRLS